VDERSLLVCLPPSGTGRSFFRRWPRRLAGSRVLPLSRPGHEERMREPLARSLLEAAHDCVRTVLALRPDRVVLFGHSLGAAVAFEASRLVADECREVALVVSARQSPNLPGRAADLAGAPDGELLAWSGRDAGEVSELLLPALRADLRLSAEHRWDGGRTTAPLTAIGYAADDVVPAAELRGWAGATAGGYRQVVLPGGHFAALDAPESLIRILADVVADPAQPAATVVDD